MNRTNETQKWIDWIRKSPKWIGGAIALITTVISFIILFKNNFYLVATITVSVILLAILSLCVYVIFGKTPPLIDGGKGVYRFRKEYRGWALVGIVLVILFVGYAVTSGSGRLFTQSAFVGTPTPTPQLVLCDTNIMHGFGKVWFDHPEVGNVLGCPPSSDEREKATQAAYQVFEHGTMLWFDSGDHFTNTVYALFDDQTFQRFDGLKPVEIPAGDYAIGDKFSGVYWRGTGAQVAQRLGHAVSEQEYSHSAYQRFQNGYMFWIGMMDRIFVIYDYRSNSAQIRKWEEYPDVYDIFAVPVISITRTPSPTQFLQMPLMIELWPVATECNSDGSWSVDFWVGPKGGDGIYAYYADGTWVAGPSSEGTTIHITNDDCSAYVGIISVESGGDVQQKEYYVPAPECCK